ncbi:hypothetical protein C8Q79DRAFT_553317 [Trametes meyenii]|nr:hypothetical protein C8Q79DRAFT_553317 [Trametes meyenii]
MNRHTPNSTLPDTSRPLAKIGGDFCATYQAALSSWRKVPHFKHVAQDKLRRATMDLTIVACGIRLGYLFDAFTIRSKNTTLREALAGFLHSVQQEALRFRSVGLVYDSNSDQLFFVNARRLHDACTGPSRIVDTVPAHSLVPKEGVASSATFIRLKGSHAEISSAPPQLLSLCADLASHLSQGIPEQTIILSEDDRTRDIGTMVAFAACILEFPVAYVPTTEGGDAFLAGVPLDVYECILEINASAKVPTSLPDRHVMLKFSCPQLMGGGPHRLYSDTIASELRQRFEKRLEEAGFPGKMEVRHSTETLDRVAL